MAENLLGLDKQYVFYQRLKEDASKNASYTNLQYLNSNVDKSITNYISSHVKGGTFDTVAKLQAMSQIERTKEINAITMHTPQSNESREIIINYITSGNTAEIIRAVNMFMQTEKIFERNVQRIKANKDGNIGDIDVSTFLASYIDAAWRRHAAGFSQQIATANTKKEAKEKIFNEFQDVIIPEALMAMLNSADFKGGDTRAYQELIDTVQAMKGNQLYEQWVNDTLKRMGINTLIKENLTKKDNKKFGFKVPKGAFSIRETKGGTNEDFGAFINNVVNITNGKNDLESLVVGGKQIKPDIITIQVETKQCVQPLLDDDRLKTGATRGEHVEAIGEYTPQLQNNFIIFTNAKNYVEQSQKSGYSFGGFDTGVFTKNLREFGDLSQSQLGNNQASKIGAILQTIDGAYLSDNASQKDQVLATLSEDFAYFLFDDWKMIGTSNNQALHLFYLDGIYLPLSVLLDALAKTIGNILKNPVTYFNVSIKGSIDRSIATKELGTFTADDWQTQRELALENTTIEARFLHDFFEFIRDTFQ